MKFRQRKLREQVLVITGATSGIGLATARMAADAGARLVLISRNRRALDKLRDEFQHAGTPAIAVTADVADCPALEKAARTAIRRFGRIDTWVNNAGVSMWGKLMEVPLEDERRLFETNFWGVVNGSLVATGHLKQQGGGTLINIGSIVSNRALPPQGTYSASKHAAKAFTDALRMELEKEGAPVAVTLIKPSPIDTPLPAHARNHIGAEAKLPPPYYSPDVVARTILHCAEKKHRDVTVGGGGAALIWAEKLAPRLTDKVLNRTTFALHEKHDRPPQQEDNLYDPPGPELEESGGYTGFVANRSLYAWTRLHAGRIALAAAGAGAGVAVGCYLRSQKQQNNGRRWFRE